MEVIIHGTSKASKFELEDYISRMPDNVVSNILDRLPVHEAVRTGILARYWRFKWTLLTQLVFDSDFFRYLVDTKGENNCGRIISRLLLHLRGVITKFVLCISYPLLDEEDINNWMLFLSRNGIKDLTLFNMDLKPPPVHVFSCMDLKHLNLNHCCFNPPASFHGFSNVKSLWLCDVQFKRWKIGEFFTWFPVLEVLNMRDTKVTKYTSFREGVPRKRSPTTFSCLKTLKMSNINLGRGNVLSFASEIIRSFPNLQTLEIAPSNMCYNAAGSKNMSPATFFCLKTFKLLEIDFGNDYMLSFAYGIIMNSPNLQTLTIIVGDWKFEQPSTVCSFEVDYKTTEMLQLRTVVFRGLEGLENEVCLIKYLLASSPLLEKIAIHTCSLHSNEKLAFSTKLLKLHRASPNAEINLY